MSATRIGLVGESALVERGVASVLADADGVAFAGRTTAAECAVGGWNVVLFDLYGRLDAAAPRLRHLALEHPDVTVVLFAYHLSPAALREARGLGVRSFVSKALDPAELLAALTRIAAGEQLVAASSWHHGADRAWPGHHEGLSEREGQVLALAAEGLTTREMADALTISPETVRSHLKRAYHRLGLRNRAEAAAFVGRAGHHGAGRAGGGFAPPPVAPSVDPQAMPNWPALLRSSLLDESALSARRVLFAVSDADRPTLAPLAPFIDEVGEAVGRDLVRRVLASPHSGTVLRSPASLERLQRHQLRYTRSLVNPEPAADHAVEMVALGATLHGLRLSPQWYLAACAHLLRHCITLVCTRAPTPAQAAEWLTPLLRRVLFDASLAVDAFERCMRDELQPADSPARTAGDRALGRAVRNIVVSRLTPTIEDWDARCAFLDLDDGVPVTLRPLASHLAGVIDRVIDDCGATVGARWPAANNAPDDVRRSVQASVARYWIGLTDTTFDRTRAASCARSGVVHVRIGLTHRFYLAALAQQICGVLPTIVERPGAHEEIDALVRALVFDAGFTVDGYLEARAEELVQANHIAGQVVSGLATSVLVVDRHDRVESANGDLAALATLDAGVRRRLTLASALPLEGIEQMVAEARMPNQPRMTARYQAWGRQLQVSVIGLRDSLGEREGRVALVVSDLTDALTASSRLDDEGRRLAHVLDAVDAVAWDLDRETLTVLGISSGAARVLGVRDTDLLGTTALVERVHEDDREAFIAVCRRIGDGERETIEHRVHRPDGAVSTVKTSLSGYHASTGGSSVSGVTVNACP